VSCAAIGANIALVAAGCYIRLVNHALSTSFAGDTQLLSLRVLIGTVMVMTVAMFGSKAFIDSKILQPAAAAAAAAGAASTGGKAPKKKKSKGSFAEGLAVLKNSPKIRNLALLVMSYGVGHRYETKCHSAHVHALWDEAAQLARQQANRLAGHYMLLTVPLKIAECLFSACADAVC
jgi:ATP/ADP translocase